MKRLYPFFILLPAAVLFAWNAFTQKKKNRQKEAAEIYHTALQLYNEPEPTAATDSLALQLFLKAADAFTAKNDLRTAAVSCIKAGTIHQTYKRFAGAKSLYFRALELNSCCVNDPALTYEASLYLGSSDYFTGVFDSARHYFEKASAIDLQYPDLALPEKEQLYNSLGAIYFESSDYLQARKYFEKALQSSNPAADDYSEIYVTIKSNIINCILLLKQYSQAVTEYHHLISYMKTSTTLTSYTNFSRIINHKMGQAFFDMKQYDSALYYYNQTAPADDIFQVRMLNDAGRICTQKNEWSRAEAFFDSAAAVSKRISAASKNKHAALSYLCRSQLAEKQGLTDEAISWSNQALEELHFDFTGKRPDDLPADITRTVSHTGLFEVLQHKAALLQKKYRLTGSIRYIEASVNTYIAAINTANFIKRAFDNDESRLFFAENFSSIYHNAMAAAYELYSKEPGARNAGKCLQITEYYKGSIIYHNLQNIELKNKAGLPGAMIQLEKETKQLIAFYTNRLNNNETPGDAPRLREKLLEKQVELSRIQKQYEQDPRYSFLKYNTGTSSLTISAIQQWLDNETVLFHYMAAGDTLYAAAVNKTDYEIKKLVPDSTFYSSTATFISETSRHTEGRRYEGTGVSARLYNFLIKPFSSLSEQKKRWVILPDGILNYLPFDAMVKDSTVKRYVVQDHIVTFHYTFTLLTHENTIKSAAGDHTGSIIFAPFALEDSVTNASGIVTLPSSAEELKVEADRKKTGSMATKQQFLAAAGQAELIHLATHAQAGSDTTGGNWIQFYPSDRLATNSRLYLHEIYNLDLSRTRLVVLSACETAAGKSLTGEGLQSLSRAFLYAGSKGVVSTLWKTADDVSAWLMQRMHHHLDRGKQPDEALQLAKNDLLNSSDQGQQYKTPNYWGNFIYAGKITPQKQKTGINTLLPGAIAVIALVMLVLYKKRKS